MRCRRPERTRDDSNEMTLAFAPGWSAGSSGGPASRNAMRSCVFFDILVPPGERGESVGDAVFTGARTSTKSSSPSSPARTSSRSMDSRFTCFLRVFWIPPGAIDVGGGAAFCEPCRRKSLGPFEAFREIPSLSRGCGTFEMEIDRRRWSLGGRVVMVVVVAVNDVLRILADDGGDGSEVAAGAWIEEPDSSSSSTMESTWRSERPFIAPRSLDSGSDAPSWGLSAPRVPLRLSRSRSKRSCL